MAPSSSASPARPKSTRGYAAHYESWLRKLDASRSAQVFVHRQAKRSAALLDDPKPPASVQMLGGVAHMHVGAHRLHARGAADEQRVQQGSTDTGAPRRTRPDIFRADRGNAQKEKIHHNASCEHNRDAVGADQ